MHNFSDRIPANLPAALRIRRTKQELLLACFAQQEAPLRTMISGNRATPELPASYLLKHPDFTLIYTTDKINLDPLV